MVALKVLKDPIVSMSITVLKAFAERLARGAMKLPAAPALSTVSIWLETAMVERGHT